MNKPIAAAEQQPDFRARFTTREFLEMGEAGAFADMKVELVHGELERMNQPMSEHGRVQSEIGFKLRLLLQTSRDWTVYGEVGIDLDEDTLLGGDVVIAKHVDGNRMLRPDEVLLVVEVASTTLSRDLGMKRHEYGRASIANYWVVDIDRRVLHRFIEPTGGEYLALASLRFGEPVPVPGSDGGTIVLD